MHPPTTSPDARIGPVLLGIGSKSSMCAKANPTIEAPWVSAYCQSTSMSVQWRSTPSMPSLPRIFFSPLADVLARHGDFFDLFRDFRGYVDHFLLNELVWKDYGSVKFLTTFDDFAGDPLPAASVAEYRTYLSRSMPFVRARNQRIHGHAASELHDRT